MNRCLICYKATGKDSAIDFHEKCSQKIFKTAKPPRLDYSLKEINDLATELVKRRVAVTGVQPKLSLSLESRPQAEKRLTIVGLWEGLYVLKPPSEDFFELPQNEDLSMHLAQIAGIKTAPHCLIKFKSGELAYLSARFDRYVKRNKVYKIHQEDMCQITGLLTENKYNSSMEQVARAVNKYTTNKGLELLELVKVSLFSFLIGNSDMHLKNFSLVYKSDGSTELSPAYDLLATKLVMPDDLEESALTICGKKNRLSRQDFKRFAEYCKINDKAYENLLKKFENSLPNFKKMISMSFLSDCGAQKYLDIVSERAQTLGLSVPVDFSELDRQLL